MAAIATFAEDNILKYILGASSASAPSKWAISIANGAPTNAAGSEAAAATVSRQSVTFSSQAVGTFTNAAAMTFAFGAAMTASGLVVWDSLASSAVGNMLWYGNLATVRTLGSGDSLVVAAGALSISLS